MLCIHSPYSDIYFNLAAEEYLFKNFSEDVFMLWRNEPSIVVGKHQNTMAEINHNFVKNNKVLVARRLSGGGTVYHDEGNLNFTFITEGVPGKLVDFKKFTRPVQDWLKSYEVDTVFEGKNNLTIHGKKISGNAEHVFKNRVLHHGTLLYSSEMKDLSKALKVNLDSYKDKAVKSIRSAVTNISPHMNVNMDIKSFQESLMNHIKKINTGAKEYQFTKNDLSEVQELVNNKYNTWDWIYGYSPTYIFSKTTELRLKKLSVSMKVEKGIIVEAKIEGDYFENEILNQLSRLAVGQAHSLLVFTSLLEDLPNLNKESIPNEQELISIFF